jgi:hypothetical protein
MMVIEGEKASLLVLDQGAEAVAVDIVLIRRQHAN